MTSKQPDSASGVANVSDVPTLLDNNASLILRLEQMNKQKTLNNRGVQEEMVATTQQWLRDAGVGLIFRIGATWSGDDVARLRQLHEKEKMLSKSLMQRCGVISLGGFSILTCCLKVALWGELGQVALVEAAIKGRDQATVVEKAGCIARAECVSNAFRILHESPGIELSAELVRLSLIKGEVSCITKIYEASRLTTYESPAKKENGSMKRPEGYRGQRGATGRTFG